MKKGIFYLYYSYYRLFEKQYHAESFAYHVLASNVFAFSLTILTTTTKNIIYYFFDIELIKRDNFVSVMILTHVLWAVFIYFYAGFKNKSIIFSMNNDGNKLLERSKINPGILFLIFSFILFLLSGYLAYWPRN